MKELSLIKETMSSIEIAELAEKPHNDVLKAIRTMEPAWEKVAGGKFSLSEYKDSTGRTLPMYELSKSECLYIAAKFNDETRAKLVLRWEQLETERRAPIVETRTDMLITFAKGVADILGMNDNSKLIMMRAVAKEIDAPLAMLPSYTESVDQLLSGTELLKRNASELSIRSFNSLMVDRGLLEEKTRNSSHGEKKFKSLVGEGLTYGENQVSPNNPKETQPLYYPSKFAGLLKYLKNSL